MSVTLFKKVDYSLNKLLEDANERRAAHGGRLSTDWGNGKYFAKQILNGWGPSARKESGQTSVICLIRSKNPLTAAHLMEER